MQILVKAVQTNLSRVLLCALASWRLNSNFQNVLKQTIPAAVILVTGAAVFFIHGCKNHPPPSEWNLLWIVIDDLKADHLGSAGYERKVTPELDRLAKSGVRFSWCVTQSPWSLPSYASMLSSRYPYELVLGDSYLKHIRAETDVARSRDPYRMPDMNHHWYVPVNKKAPLLAEILQQSGLSTAAWVNNSWLSPGAYGMERGFGHYFDGVAHHSPYTPADETAAMASKWIRENASSRWFAFVQFMDPHRPYQPHPEFSFGSRFIDLYDSEIAFTDRALGAILKTLDELELGNRTIIVVNSDHGEGVFEDNKMFVGHGGGVIPQIVRVPLVIRWPGGPEDREVKALCRNLDIMPTVLELLEAPEVKGMQGRSLLADIKGKAKTSALPAYTMAVLKGPEQISLILQGDKPDRIFQAAITPAYQQASVFRITGKGKEGGVSQELTRRIMQDITKFTEQADRSIAESKKRQPPDLDEKTKAGLRALGYLQ